MPLLKSVHWIALSSVISTILLPNTNSTNAYLRFLNFEPYKSDLSFNLINIYNPFWMLGYCAEYDADGGLVQDNYDLECQQRRPPCPALYNSAEA